MADETPTAGSVTDKIPTTDERAKTADPDGEDLQTTEFKVSIGEDAPDAQALADQGRELVAATLRQLQAVESDDTSKSRLHHTLGLILEHRLGDVRRALNHYLEARRLSPSNLAAIRSARRLFLSRQNWTMVLELLDDELSMTSTPARAARLLLQKGRIYEHWLASTDLAIEAYAEALRYDPGNRQAMGLTKSLMERRRDAQGLIDICQRAAASSVDKRDRGQILGQMGQVYEYQVNNEQAAIESYAAAFTEDPANVSVASALKRLYHRRGRWRDLVDVLLVEGGLVAGGQRIAAYLEAAGICRRALDQPDRALELLSKAQQLAQDDPTILEEMADLLQEAGRYEELADVHRRRIACLVDDRERAAAQVTLGQILEDRLGQPQEAIACYRQALALDPSYIPALKSVGRLCQRRGEWDELVAISAAEADVMTDTRQRAVSLCGLAELCETQLGDTQRAIDFHRRALAGLPLYSPSIHALERLYTEQKDWVALFDLLASQLEQRQGEDRGRLLLHLGDLCDEKLGDLERASTLYERALEDLPKEMSLVRTMQQVYTRMKRWDRVVLALEREIQHTTDEPLKRALMHRAAEICEVRMGDLDGAIERYRQILALVPDTLPTLQALGRIYFRLGRWEDVVALYQLEVDHAPSQSGRKSSLLYKMGEIYLEQLNDIRAAEHAFLEALDVAPRFLPAIQALARIYRREGAFDKLIDTLRRKVDLLSDPARRAATLHSIGEVYERELEQEERAIECYREALQRCPTSQMALTALMRLLTVKERYRELAEVCLEAVHSAESRQTRLTLLKRAGGIWEQQLMDPERAVTCYEQALTLAEQDMEVLSALANLYRRRGNTQELVEIHQKLSRCSVDTAQATGHLYAAVNVVEVHFPQQDPTPIYERIVEIDGQERSALEALDGMIGAADLARRIEVCEAQRQLEDDPDCRVAMLLQSAGLREAAGDPESALQTLRKALTLTENWVVQREHRRLCEKLGDWEEVAQSLLSEARLGWEPELAAESLMRAAMIYREQLEDRKREAETLALLLKVDPFNDEAAERLEQLLVQRKAWNELVEVLRRRLDVIASGTWPGDRSVTQVQIELLVRMAWIQRQHLNRPLEAVATLTRSLQLDPNHLSTLMTLGDLYTELELYKEAVDISYRIVAVGSDLDILRRTHFRLGEIWSEKLGDVQQAISSFQNVLALFETDCDALIKLSQMFAQMGDWDNAADILGRLIEVEQEPAESVKHHAALAEIQLEQFGDPRVAARQLKQALAIEPTNEAILSDLSLLLEQAGEWEALAEALRSFLAALPRDQDSRGIVHRLRLGEILRHRLGRSMEALEQYRAVVEIDPTNVEARLSTGNILVEEGRLEEAMIEHRDIQNVDRLNIESLLAMRDIWSRMGNLAMAQAVDSALVVLGQDVRTIETLAEERTSRTRVDESVYESIVVHPDEHHAGRGILSILGDVAHRIRPPHLASWQVGKADRLPSRSENPLRSLVREVSGVLGLEHDVDIYISRARPRELDLLLTDPVAIVAGQDAMTATTSKGIRFWLGCLLSYLRNRTWIAYRLSGPELQRLIKASCVVAEAKDLVSEAEKMDLGDMVQLIQRSMSRRGRRALQEACNDLLVASEPDYGKWAWALKYTSVHTGLWVVNDLGTALDHLGLWDKRLGSREQDDQPVPYIDRVKRSPLAAEIVQFWMSEDYISLMQATQG